MSKVTLEIWNVSKKSPDWEEILFTDYKRAKEKGYIKKANYEKVYENNEWEMTSVGDLEKIFVSANIGEIRQDPDFKGHSMSVGDVVVIKGDDLLKGAFYVDNIGFKRIAWH